MSKVRFEKNYNPVDGRINYLVFNWKKEFLGQLWFRDDWNCWVWEQMQEIVMSKDCLLDIFTFMDVLPNVSVRHKSLADFSEGGE